jgi:threonyl-tRNA synthetase
LTSSAIFFSMATRSSGVKISIGPAIDDGFYYDFDFPEGTHFSEADFPRVEAKMAEHIKAAEPFTREDVPAEVALERFKAEDQPYKVELIEDLIKNEGVETVGLYTNGAFVDLCRGPHAPTTKTVKAVKLQSVAGAYWRGDANRRMLTRVYGTAFLSKDDLEAHLQRIEEAKARDHRKLGRELDLFQLSEVSPGRAFWLPKRTHLFNELVGLSREMGKTRGYTEVKTPQIYDSQLWKTSGHWDKYRENMFVTESEGRQLALKPMNCPGHILIFKQGIKSYRDLPLRYGEFGQCHRNEPSGGLHGIMRVRGFTQDDGHIFCTEDQILSECVAYTTLLQKVYADFGFKNIIYKVATRPEQRIGSDEVWDKAEHALIECLRASGCDFEISPGEGAFYGPKIEYTLKDAIGRQWQCGTMQVDFSMPERLDAEYVGEDGARHRPVMLHRAIVGSLERFIGILIEEHAGALPTWLAPVQVSVLNITDAQAEYARDVVKALKNQGLRVELDLRNEKITYKIREHSMQKLPYILVVGDKEKAAGAVAVRARGNADLGVMSLDAFAQLIAGDIANKR